MNTDKNTQTDILIIGSGPAGYTAAIYAARANRSPIVVEGLQPGGQLTETTSIENFPGYPEGVGGFEMMDDLRKQAERYGADIRSGLVSEIDLSQRPFVATVDSEYTITAKSVIIATGASAMMLGLPEVSQEGEGGTAGGDGSIDPNERDNLFDVVAERIVAEGRVSISLIQQIFAIGYNRAARLCNQLEAAGIISKPDGRGSRDLLVTTQVQLERILHPES